jgi:predicted nucleic acid-binding protein
MNPTVYLETSVVSYLAALPSRDLLTAAHQQVTHLWWRTRRSSFGLIDTQLGIDEFMAGDADAAERRLALVRDLQLLDIGPEVTDLARYLATSIPLPPRAATDAFHIAIAARHGIDYLLTWNCAHIANAELRPRIDHACVAHGYAPPILCTPEELIGVQSDDS